MAWKDLSNNSFANAILIEHGDIKELDKVHNLVDGCIIEVLLSGIHNKSKGEKSWPPLMMFKALLLQSWYQLSDPGLEKQLARDLLFRRFIRLDISESVPDHSTFWRFRQKLEKLSLMDTLLDAVNEQLSEQGLYLKSGEVSIVDASVIEANQCRPHQGKDGKPTQDTDADWNVKAGSDGKVKSTYGFKAHINVDEDGFIKKTDYSSGSPHDSNYFTELLSGQETAAYADSAYKSEVHDTWLAKHGIDNRVIRKAYRNKPLTEDDKHFNRLHSGTRSIVERVFGVLKQHYGMAKARYLGLARNQTRFQLMCIAHNLKRGLSVSQLSCA